MSYAYLIISVYPFWALPLAFIFFELGNRSRTKGFVKSMSFYYFACLFLLFFVGVYIYYEGYRDLKPIFNLIRHFVM